MDEYINKNLRKFYCNKCKKRTWFEDVGSFSMIHDAVRIRCVECGWLWFGEKREDE